RRDWAAGDAVRDAGLTEPAGVEQFKNLSYGPYGEANLLDVFRPEDRKGEVLPVIVNIHGGGFFYGDKELYRFYCLHLAEFGFAVVSFNYRLSPEWHFPAPLEDTLAVMNWIGAHASEYGLDPKQVFLTGDSAGAELSAHYACIATDPSFATAFGFVPPASVQIRGVSLACGLYDLVGEIGKTDEFVPNYLGDGIPDDDPRLMLPDHVTDAFPPAYVFSSVNDFLHDACEPFARLIMDRGGYAESRIYGTKEETEVSHVFHLNMRLPIGEEANRDQIAFFRKLLEV
ncbi:MAG: alpha/beta hydrolase, partial [Lachnospiraceae bacterium]|nr:alpha/beta hydrolase [Lachnospiraceae bacterium]